MNLVALCYYKNSKNNNNHLPLAKRLIEDGCFIRYSYLQKYLINYFLEPDPFLELSFFESDPFLELSLFPLFVSESFLEFSFVFIIHFLKLISLITYAGLHIFIFIQRK